MAEAEEIGELSEVYNALRKDAKNLISDMAELMDATRSDSHVLIMIGVFGLFATLGLSASKQLGFWDTLAFGVVAALLVFDGFWNLRRLGILQKRYATLFGAAKRLN